MAFYQPYNPKWWSGRMDGNTPEELRWHQVIDGLNFDLREQVGIALLGFSSDEGVRRNNGRTGAVGGPEHIQKSLCNLPVQSGLPIRDAGNVLCDNEDLEGAQKLLGQKVAAILKTGCTPIVLGGGHEIAWGHFQGLVQAYPDSNIGIINFDAHFDLRSADQANSGTPFLQIAKFQESRNGAFNYMVLGIQRHSNTKILFNTADQLGVNYYYDSDFHALQLPILQQAVIEFAAKVDLLYLTIDMDCFNACHAPGVSAANARGLSPDAITFSLLRTIIQTGKVRTVDLAEVNPKYDIDNRTGKLAACLIFELVQELEKSV